MKLKSLRAFGVGFSLIGQAVAQTIEVTATGVGIGTTTPGAALDVVGTVLVSGTTNPYLILKSNATGSPYGFLQYDHSEGDFMRIWDGSDYSMAWKAGKVGIGTTS